MSAEILEEISAALLDLVSTLPYHFLQCAIAASQQSLSMCLFYFWQVKGSNIPLRLTLYDFAPSKIPDRLIILIVLLYHHSFSVHFLPSGWGL